MNQSKDIEWQEGESSKGTRILGSCSPVQVLCSCVTLASIPVCVYRVHLSCPYLGHHPNDLSSSGVSGEVVTESVQGGDGLNSGDPRPPSPKVT